MNKENCALKLVDEIILYYDARSKNHHIGKKMFTYIYNKFRPVNRMHYITCGVNSSLLT